MRVRRSLLLPVCLLIVAAAMLWHAHAVPALDDLLRAAVGPLSTPLALLLSIALGGGALYLLLRSRVGRATVAFGEYRRQLRLLADELPVGLITLSGDRFVFVNRVALRQLGWPEHDLPTQAPVHLLGAAARDALTATQPFDGVLPLRHAEGRQFSARVRARTVELGARRLHLLLIDDLSEEERIHARLAQQHDELQAMARRLLTLQEDERLALSRELHDDVGQAITAIKLCAMSLQADAEPELREATAAEIIDTADQTITKLRDLSLLLRPPQLDALGLEAALRWHAGRMFRAGRPVLSLALTPLPERPDPTVELACFRIAQEALTNVRRHARADRVSVALETAEGGLTLVVEDDGHGFDRGEVQGLGLVTMRERAQQVGGTLDVDSGQGLGTRIRVRLPMRDWPADGDDAGTVDRHARESGDPLASGA